MNQSQPPGLLKNTIPNSATINALFDTHGRQTTYLRLAVTDRCNLRCRYCMPAEGIDFAPRDELLSYEEILTLADVLAGLGIEKVRLTGGEPLARRDIGLLVQGLGQRFRKLAITTNGILLPGQLDQLIADGLTNYNLSLDTLQAAKFARITRRDEFAATWAALEALLARGVNTKINVVVMQGSNDDELADFVALTEHRALDVRFIEAMPFNDGDGNHHLFLSATDILARLRERYPTLAPAPGEANASALHYRVPGFRGGVGIIPAYSRSLCGSCNRLRLTPKGTLLNCLYSTQGLELRPLLRAGAGGEDLAALIVDFVRGKHATGHDTERIEQVAGGAFASMTSIGG
ncbi:GTP 3',8-cyclase MoaA [Neolewinella lacunae]|uniref:GTP 3',8-cyclase n=1 Tax=Neolewinella lacunae TaxID=1517758 RepID=A0A923PR07_9BACT|nr:GTP 3',8-cyclase MoaA [Neolewinella lacunae]MBC6996181.1 GTP 3',8-cyclase MoaA [Neolewinella lacunae]MDN3635355.1 GTP 3',8-cyclase MoaA [Neolewinella lacunae]